MGQISERDLDVKFFNIDKDGTEMKTKRNNQITLKIRTKKLRTTLSRKSVESL